MEENQRKEGRLLSALSDLKLCRRAADYDRPGRIVGEQPPQIRRRTDHRRHLLETLKGRWKGSVEHTNDVATVGRIPVIRGGAVFAPKSRGGADLIA